jgi:N-acyl-D-aspartate/D-glutamate deacylase
VTVQEFDVLIRGGDVVDGTGVARRAADVAVRDGRVVGVGEVKGDARRTIDARGMVVCPGFIDVHTHYDVQGFWDPTLSPSPLHGVTSVVAGNCGFGVAPLDDQAGDYLMRMLSRVEGMPLASLQVGVPWDWRTMDEYLGRLDGSLSVNAGFMVGHSTIRRVVMGDAATQRPATPSELEAMQQLLRAGIEAGGLGFSSSYAQTHNDAAGDPVPSRHAPLHELVELARVVGEYSGTSLEFLPHNGPTFPAAAVEAMTAMSAAAGRTLNWNILQVSATNGAEIEGKLAASDYARERGGSIVALVMPARVAARLNFTSGFGLDTLPGWDRPMALPPVAKLNLLADRVERKKLEESASQPNPSRHLANWATYRIAETFSPATAHYVGREVGEIALAEGKSDFDAMVDIACADELRTTFSLPVVADTRADWEARVDVIRDSRTLVGASDAGAHLDMLGTFNYPTHLLADGVRRYGVLTTEEAVHHLTQAPARLYGIRERGVLRTGAWADIVVFDESTVGTDELATRADLPGGAARLYAAATGVAAVMVNGEVIVEADDFTEARPGSIIRSGRDTATVPIG